MLTTALHGRGRAAVRPAGGDGRGEDRGRGDTRELIERYSTPEVLEPRFDPADHEQSAEKLASVPAAAPGDAPDRVLLYSRTATPPWPRCAPGLEPLFSLVRRSRLEDVFLRLTGRQLGESVAAFAVTPGARDGPVRPGPDPGWFLANTSSCGQQPAGRGRAPGWRRPGRPGHDLRHQLPQLAAGQAQEDVLQRAAPDQRGQRLDAQCAHRRQGGVAVLDVEQHPVGEHLQALRGHAGQLLADCS